MSITLDFGSRFQQTDVIIVPVDGVAGGAETFGVWNKPSFLRTRPPAELIGSYTVMADRAGKPDLIAVDVYGTSLLDWVIIAFNGPNDVLNWPDAGVVIEYPLPGVVFSEID